MSSALLAQVTQAAFDRPIIDWHAMAPEIVLVAGLAVVVLVDVILLERARRFLPLLAGIAMLVALIPVVTLAIDGADRSMFGGAYAVDRVSLVLKALFLLAGYVVVLLSTNFVAADNNVVLGDFNGDRLTDYLNLLLPGRNPSSSSLVPLPRGNRHWRWRSHSVSVERSSAPTLLPSIVAWTSARRNHRLPIWRQCRII